MSRKFGKAKDISYLKSLRVYRNLPTSHLLNSIIVWNACKVDAIVDNSEFLYKNSLKIFGNGITHCIMTKTMGK